MADPRKNHHSSKKTHLAKNPYLGLWLMLAGGGLRERRGLGGGKRFRSIRSHSLLRAWGWPGVDSVPRADRCVGRSDRSAQRAEHFGAVRPNIRAPAGPRHRSIAARVTRAIGRKLDCLSPNPSGETSTPAAPAPKRSATRGRSSSFRDRPPPTGGSMKNDFIEGDEWDAYVALDTFGTSGTRDGLTGASPMVTESSL